jgi:hypothetical protein
MNVGPQSFDLQVGDGTTRSFAFQGADSNGYPYWEAGSWKVEWKNDLSAVIVNLGPFVSVTGYIITKDGAIDSFNAGGHQGVLLYAEGPGLTSGEYWGFSELTSGGVTDVTTNKSNLFTAIYNALMGDMTNMSGNAESNDPDADGDGFPDHSDAFPNDPNETTDTDGDGVGDNADAFPDDSSETVDSDLDGVGDNSDAFPNDANETTDTDGDGVGDNSDPDPNDPTETTDTDGDGVGDNADEYPNDPNETTDSDGDGVGDNADAFPDDDSETVDTDGDGVGDNADAYPNDANETADTDGDGVGDNADVYPDDPNETSDTDGDGVGDNADAFPTDSTETTDTDGDGVGDNADAFPTDSTETTDTDGDGVGDNADVFPSDSTEWGDKDGDGVGDNTELGWISGLAGEIYDTELGFETGSLRDSEVVNISGWLEANIGVLNTYINSSYCVSDLTPTGHYEERAIYKQIYVSEYYGKQARNVLRGIDGSSTSLDFQTIREGDSVITKTNKNNVASNYRLMKADSDSKLKDLVHAYNMYKADPRQVYGDD